MYHQQVTEIAEILAEQARGFTQQGAKLVIGEGAIPVVFGFSDDFTVYDLITEIVDIPVPGGWLDRGSSQYFADMVQKLCYVRGILFSIDHDTTDMNFQDLDAIMTCALLVLDEMDLRIEQYTRNR